MFKISVGTSTDPDTAEAVGDVVAQCLSRFGAKQPKAGIVFNVGHEQDSTILRAITDTWPEMILLGSASQRRGQEHNLTLMLLDSADLDFVVGIGHGVHANPGRAAENAIGKFSIEERERVVMCLTLSDFIADWNQRFTEAISHLLPSSSALMNDLLPFESELQQRDISHFYHGNQILDDGVPVLLAVSPAPIGSGRGWSLTRHHGIVRRNCGDNVYEYDTLIGDRRRQLRA